MRNFAEEYLAWFYNFRVFIYIHRMNQILEKYAKLLVNYCLEVKAGEKVFIKSSTLAEPLIKEVYREVIRNGAYAEVDMAFEDKAKIFLQEANHDQLKINSPFNALAIKDFDAYLSIRAPHNLEETKDIDKEKLKNPTRGFS